MMETHTLWWKDPNFTGEHLKQLATCKEKNRRLCGKAGHITVLDHFLTILAVEGLTLLFFLDIFSKIVKTFQLPCPIATPNSCFKR